MATTEDSAAVREKLEQELSDPLRVGPIRPPDAVFHWQDSKPTGAEGWVVMDRIINRAAGGGIFMHAEATEQETADIARNMSKKFTVCNPQIGGAKGGIRFDHRDPRAKDVLRRFILANEQLLRNAWVTAGDLNTDDGYIESIVQGELGLPTMQHVLAKSFSRATGQPDRGAMVGLINRHPATKYFPLIEGAVGCGVAESIRVALELTNPSLLGKARVAIQGFGAVGSSLAYYLVTRKIAVVVSLADKDGFVTDPNGLDVIAILDARLHRRNELAQEKADPKLLNECNKNFWCNLSHEQIAQFNGVQRTQPFTTAGNVDFLGEFLKAQQAEVFSPCALRYQLTLSTTEFALANFWAEHRYLVCGANNPFGTINKEGRMEEDRTGQVEAALRAGNVCVVPDWVANSGTAQLFHRGVSVDFNLKDPHVAERVLEAVTDPMRQYITRAFRLVKNQAAYLPYGCSQLAEELLMNPQQLYVTSKATNPAKSRYCLPPMVKSLGAEERLKRCLSLAVECVDKQQLEKLISTCANPVAYDGFEPSGRMHVAQGIYKRNIVDQFTSAGFTYIFYIADWFAVMNHKLGGDKDRITTVGLYFREVWKALGMDVSRVRFLFASDEIKSRGDEYWSLVLDLAAQFNLSDVDLCHQVLGRKPEEMTKVSHALYPCMQIADAFFLGADVCQMGTDQKNVNTLLRSYAKEMGKPQPVYLSHHLLSNTDGTTKMSKSKPETAIFMDDDEQTVNNKVNGLVVSDDASKCVVREYYKYLVFQKPQPVSVTIAAAKGDKTVTSVDELSQALTNGDVTKEEIKTALAANLNKQLEPVRAHFSTDPLARELAERVKNIFA